MLGADSTIVPLAATDWTAAIAGIVGVVVGGAITTAGTVWTQRRADRRERDAEARELTATVWLLHSNLLEVSASLEAVERDRVWQAPTSGEQWLTLWQDRSSALAGAMSKDGLETSQEEFEIVAESFLITRVLLWRASREERDLSEDDRELIRAWQEKIQEALKILRRPPSRSSPTMPPNPA